MQKPLRAFIAIPLPGTLGFCLRQVQERLCSTGVKISRVTPKNIHLTLKFLGDVDPSRIDATATQMDTVAGSSPTFFLRAQGVGVFPNTRQARVFWVGLAGDLDRLRSMQANLESRLESIGFLRDPRNFRAHLTIGRIRRRMDRQTIGAVLEALQSVASDPFRVDRLVLFKSTLRPAGAEHTALHTSYLKTHPDSQTGGLHDHISG